MGNVHAFSAAPPPPNPGMPFTKDVEEKSETEKIENPGPLDEIHNKCKNIFPTCFEGARVMLTRGLSNHFQISHTINMSSVTPSGYRFGATYVGTKQLSPSEAYPILLGDIDPSGNLNATIIHQICNNVQAKFGAQVQNSKFTVGQLTMNYKGSDYTASCTVANPNIINNSGVVVLHYLQSVTPRLALGTELAYQKGAGVPGGQIALLSAAAKYSTDLYQVSGTLGVSGVHLCYYQKASKQLQIGVELEANHRMQESVASIGYQVDLPKSELVFKGHIDSNWSVGAVLEKKLVPLPFTLALSGLLNHQKNQFRLGIGILIG
ncbi:mitochondrial import receptor subunit TOM40 homolog 1-like [Harmonia axyridis]|uniref:mitochondrial import receptor subunit TOM40 homolog 1-like n=1 Tax=Harmonia axyridis TaxID=115357 RepID=UPI001E2782D2|nr:mitochondrial import receptor subunit TOM40 homolog 1-like [Harmonia axyridis]XP_045464290.1 mitochondrial import receptor subunit TOM40 homolog 1-like [Harmonia axyridis]XP_045464291.1 mitochondrial import receptor subunit TOM40 homolog 1-like [Harmonia axyridis]